MNLKKTSSKKKPVKKAKVKKTTVKKSKPKKTVLKKTVKKAVKKAVKKVTPKTLVQKAVVKQVVVVKKAAPKIDYTKAITPLLDRLVVRVLTGERVTPGGLIIPETASMATGYLKAEVLAVGRGAQSKKGHLKPLDVQIGDHVLFSDYAGIKVQFHSEDLHIINETDVMGILQNSI